MESFLRKLLPESVIESVARLVSATTGSQKSTNVRKAVGGFHAAHHPKAL